MNCKNEKLLAKIGKKKLTKETEVDFTVLDPIDECRRINTKDYVATDATSGTVTYDRYTIPDDAFNCYGDKCANSGTLNVPAGKYVIYRIPYNALDETLGVISFYAKLASASDVVTVTISDTKEMTNADVYTPNFAYKDGKFVPIVVDITQAPGSTEGTGWSYVAGSPVYVKISSSAAIGISTIAMFDSLEAFDTMNVVKIACLSGIDGAWALDLAEDTCIEEGDYDTENPTFEFTVTGRLLTPNFNILNPMEGKGDKTVGWQIASVEKSTVAGTSNKYNGKSYVTLDDVNQEECGFLSVQIEDYCQTTDSQMIRLNLPVADGVTLDDRHYIVINNADGTTDIVFGLAAGIKVLISYPQNATIEHYVGNLNNLVGKQVRMSFPEILTDGTKYVHILNNLKVTSFPWTLSNEDGEFEITLQAKRDVNDNFYERMRIISTVVNDV